MKSAMLTCSMCLALVTFLPTVFINLICTKCLRMPTNRVKDMSWKRRNVMFTPEQHINVALFVKSTSPTTENWLRKLCTYSMNNNTSNEDKHDTNYINNKYTNTYTRKLHNL